MLTKIKATNYVMTPDVSAYLDIRLAALEKLVDPDDESVRCEVEIGRDAGKKQHSDHMWYAEIRIIAAGVNVYAKNRAETVNAAIDDVKEEAQRQLRHNKGKKFASMRRAGKKVKDWMRFGK